MSSGMRLFSGQRSPGNSKDSQLRKEGERDTIINDADSLSPRQRRLAKNKMVSQSRKRGAPGRVSGNIGATPKLPDGFDPSHPGDISDPRVFLEAISAYEEVGASRKILAVCDAAAEAGSRHGDGESHADTVPEALLRASVAAELRLGRPDLARDLVFKWGVGSLAPLAAAAQNGESYDRRIGAVASALPYQLQCDGDTGSTSALAPLSSASQELYKFIKALCQNGVVDAAAHVVQKLDLLSTTSERTKQRLDSEQSATLWLGMLPLVHASLARGYMKQSDWVLARQALRRWHRDAQKEEREMEGRTEAEEDSKRQHSMGVSIDVANSLLRTAAKGKDLPTLLETLETVGAIGCPANDETFEIVANAAVQSVEFVTGAVSIDTLPPMTIAGEGGGQGASSVPMPEVAFVGRSNVGKSSLVNMVCNRRAMAYTSKTPGKTQQFNYFAINSKSRWQPRGAFYLVDLPGVGYAKVPKAQRQKWLDFMRQYLYERPTLKVRALCELLILWR